MLSRVGSGPYERLRSSAVTSSSPSSLHDLDVKTSTANFKCSELITSLDNLDVPFRGSSDSFLESEVPNVPETSMLVRLEEAPVVPA